MLVPVSCRWLLTFELELVQLAFVQLEAKLASVPLKVKLAWAQQVVSIALD